MSTIGSYNSFVPKRAECQRIKTGFPVLAALIWFLFAGALCTDAAASTSAGAATAAMLDLRSAVTVTGDRIYLKDVIASGAGDYLSPYARDMVLLKAPAPGGQRTLPGAWVASVIRTKGSLPDSVNITAPEQIHIRRAHQALSPGRLEDFFSAYVQKRLGDSEFKISRIKIRGTDKFPVGAITLHLLDPEPKKITGRVSVRVMVRVDGDKSGRLTLSGWIDRYETVACAGRYLSRGSLLTAADLEYGRMNVSRMPAGVVKDINDAVGKRLRRNIKPGGYLRQNLLAVPAVIHRGDRVKLVAKSGNIRIVAVGIAKKAGGVGDQIRVENMRSKKTIVGRIKDASTVEVIF